MIVTVASFKGWVGKTTSAVHLAAYLQQQSPIADLRNGFVEADAPEVGRQERSW